MNPTVRFIIALLIGIVFAAFFGFLIGIPVQYVSEGSDGKHHDAGVCA